MGDEREVTIVIRSKNLSAEEFQKAREQIAGLKTKTDEAGKSGETFGQKLLGAKNVTALFSDQVKSMVAGFTIASLLERAVSGFVSFTKETISSADHLNDLSAKTGIGVEMLQKLDFAGSQVGISLDQVSNAVTQLQKRLAGGDSGAVAAVQGLHLNVGKLLAMNPGDMFLEIAKAVAEVPDPAKRTLIATELLGKGGAEILPLLVENFEKLASGAIIMSEKTVKSLGDIDDTMTRWSKNAKSAFGIFIAVVDQASSTTNAILSKVSGFTMLSNAINSVTIKASDLPRVVDSTANSFNRSLPPVKNAWEALAGYDKQVGKSTEQQLEAAKAAEEYSKRIKDIADRFSGAKLAQQIKETSDGFTLNGGAAKMSAYDIAGLVKEIDGFLQKGGKLTPALADFYFAHKDWNDEIDRSYDGMMKLINAVPNATKGMSDFVIPLKEIKSLPIGELLKVGAVDMSKINVKPPDFKTPLSAALARGLEYGIDQAAQSGTIKAALGALGSSVADQLGIYFATAEGAGPMTKGFGVALQLASRQPTLTKAISTFAGSMGSTIGGMLGAAIPIPMGKELGAALGSLVGPVINKFFGTAGRDAVKEFAATFGGNDGGWDNLHKKLGALGAQGEQLWIKLTQGVGKNNPKEAAAVIDQITKALDAQAASAEASAAAFQNAQDKIGSALAGVTAKVGGQAVSYLDLRQKVRDAQLAYDQLVASGAGQDEIAEAAKALALAQSEVSGATITTQAEFDRLSRVALNTFNTLVASGVSPIEAMKRIGTSVDDLMANVDAFGLSGGAAYDQLARWRTLTTENAPLLEQIGGLNDLMSMTTTLGGMNADAFKDMQTQGLDAYNQLLRAGFTEAEARAQIRPLLENEIKLARDKGYAIDDATQKIIDQARANGELTDESLSTNNILMDGLGAMIKALGGDLPDAWKKSTRAAQDESALAAAAVRDKFAKQAIDSANDVKGAITGIFDDFSGGIDIPVNFNVDTSSLDGLGGGGNGGGSDSGGSNAYASGGIAEGRQMALLAERGRREIVGDEAFMARAIKGANDRMGVSTSTSSQQTTNNYFLLDPSGRSKKLTREQLADLQRRFDGGEFAFPRNSVMGRTS